MKNKNLLNKITSVAITATMALSATAFSVSATESETYIIDEFLDNDSGITMESTSPKFRYLDTTTVPKQYADSYDSNVMYENGYSEDFIKEIYYITTYDGEDYQATQLNTEATLRIKSDIKDLYIIDLNDSNNPVDVNAEYVDGKYEFKTNHLGYFALSTKPLENKEYTYSEQTITDEDTGIIVKGLLPENVKLDVRVELYDDELYSLSFDGDAETDDSEPTPNFVDKIFYTPTISDLYTLNYNQKRTFYQEDWLSSDFTNFTGLVPRVDVVFYDDFRILELDTPLTITLPIDYRKYIEITKVDEKIDTKIIVLQSYPKENKLQGVKLLPAQDSPEGSLVIENNSTGSFFIGNRGNLNHFLSEYNGSLDDVKLYEDSNNGTENTENTEATSTGEIATTLSDADSTQTTGTTANVPVSNNAIIIIIVSAVLLAILVTVIVIFIKKKS
ncbi:MAG: hypothetical protein U0O22_00355 [Acutalibacteraceae bacterium]